MAKSTYNGWTNYATWRVNLEAIDGINFVKEDITSNEEKLLIEDVADFLRDNVVGGIIEDGDNVQDTRLIGWIEAFIADVNWREIAESVVAKYPALLE